MVNRNMLLAKIKEADLSQRIIAECMKMSKSTLSSRLNGRTTFNVDEVDRLCSILGIKDGKSKAEIFLCVESR